MLTFISYAREDANSAARLYTDLKAAGATPWLDAKDLRAGQRWKAAIKDAISQSRYFIALLSSRSINKRGYVQKELRQALEVLDEFSDLDVFLVPVRLDDCQPTNGNLKDLHWIDLFPNWNAGVSQLLQALNVDDGSGKGTLELLKRIYVEANGDEAQMLDAIRGLQGQIDRDSPDVTDQEWDYIRNACPCSIVTLLGTVLHRSDNDNSPKEMAHPRRRNPSSTKARKK